MNFWNREAEKWVDREPFGKASKPTAKLISQEIQELSEEISASSTILELGSGSGNNNYLNQQIFSNTISADISEEMLKLNQSSKKIQLDARNPIPLASNSVDICLSAFTMRYLTKIEHITLLKEIWRVLKNKGSFIILDLSDNNPYPHQYSTLSLEKISPVVKHAGFTNISTTTDYVSAHEPVNTGFGTHTFSAQVNIVRASKNPHHQPRKSLNPVEQKYIQNENNKEIKIRPYVGAF